MNPDKIEDITGWGYQADLSKLELMAAELEQLNFQCDFLPTPMIGEVLGRVKGLVDEYNIEFAQRIGDLFPCVDSLK